MTSQQTRQKQWILLKITPTESTGHPLQLAIEDTRQTRALPVTIACPGVIHMVQGTGTYAAQERTERQAVYVDRSNDYFLTAYLCSAFLRGRPELASDLGGDAGGLSKNTIGTLFKGGKKISIRCLYS